MEVTAMVLNLSVTATNCGRVKSLANATRWEVVHSLAPETQA